MISEDIKEMVVLLKSDVLCQFGDTYCQKPTINDFNKSFFNPIISEFENDMKDSLLGKVMENFESTMMKETKKIDEIKRDSEKVQSDLEKERNSRHIPTMLRNEGANLATLWRKVNNFIKSEKENIECDVNSQILKSDLSQMFLSHCFAAWLSTLDSNHYERLTQEIYSEMCHWITKIWRFRCSTSLFHNKLYDGLLGVCRVALATRLPKYQHIGYSALFSHQPIIYLSSFVDPLLSDYLQINMGLSADSVKIVPLNPESSPNESIDIIALKELILADISSGKEPLIILVDADSTGQLSAIYEFSQNHNLWLHIEGFRLAEWALKNDLEKVDSICSKVNSMTLDLGKSLAIPSVPFVTLVVSNLPEPYLHSLGFGAGYFLHNSTSLDIFPLWFSLQLIGHDGIVKRFVGQIRRNFYLVKRLKEVQNIKLLSEETGTLKMSQNSTDKKESLKTDKVTNVVRAMIDGHHIPYVIMFRYEPSGDHNGLGDTAMESGSDNGGGNKTYFNSLNHWLATNLMITYPDLNISVTGQEEDTTCIRLCLQESNIGMEVTDNLLDEFCQIVSEHVTVMNSTLQQRPIFNDIVKRKYQLLYLNLPRWAGLGCVLFIPDIFRKDLSIFPVCDDDKFDLNYDELVNILSNSQNVNYINKINKSLFEQLRFDDAAFSMGVYDFVLSSPVEENVSLICIRFGLITNSATVAQLIDLVIERGNDVETAIKNLDKMSELVKGGIYKVTEQLAKEQEEILRQQGILRQLPFIDSLINWMYPTNTNQIIGRSLNLSSGTIQTTDDTYKYKIQLHACPCPPSSNDQDKCADKM